MRALPGFSDLVRNPGWQRVVPGLTIGLITGILEVMLAISFAALIFSGPLSPYLVNGIGLALAGAILSGAAVALFTSAPGTVAGNQDIPSAIMAVAAVAVASAMPAGAGLRELYVTVVVMVGLTTALAGALFYALGRFRLGNLVRFLPYPVLGGFLAATGWLLLLGGIGIMADVSPSLDTLPLLLQPSQLARWLPGVLLGAAMVAVLKRTDHVLALPLLVFGSAGLFYAVAALNGQSTATLASAGWLMGPFPEQSLWSPPALSDLTLVHWPAIASQAANIATVLLMSAIALLLNSSSLELAMGEEVSLNRELRVAGAGNLAAGAIGGLVGFQQLSLSVMSHKVAGRSRLAGLFAVVFCVLVLLVGASSLSLIPRVTLGGLVCFLGLSLLVDSLADARFPIPRMDYLVMLLIVSVTATVGFMEAVGVGLLVAVVLFVINYSRTDVVRDELSGRYLRSRVTRSPETGRLLDELGEQLYILRLQGFIFFGTADSLLGRIRARLEDPDRPPPRFLLLDFCHVTGIDSTALLSFMKLVQQANSRRLTLVLCEPPSSLPRQLQASEVSDGTVRTFADLDHGLEWCEEQLLASAPRSALRQQPVQQELERRLGSPQRAAKLLSYFERMEVEAGHTLMRQDEASDALFLLESGQVSAFLEQDDGTVVRLQTMREWNVLGEIGFHLGTQRTASVVVESPAVVYRLSRNTFATMRERDPQIASSLQELIVQLLAERVVHLVSVVNALRR